MSTHATQILSQFEADFRKWKEAQKVFYLTPQNEEQVRKTLWLFYLYGRWDEEQAAVQREEFPDVLYFKVGGGE